MYDKLLLVGNTGKGAEMRYTPTGKPVCTFSLAVNKQYTNQSGEAVKQTKWFTITTWGKLAEICNQYVTKGMKVLVEGELTADPGTGGPRIWQRADGSAGANFEVVAATVRFLSSSSEQPRHGAQQDDFGGDPGEDIPF